MEKTQLHELAEFGQSAWLDNINRNLLESGKLEKLISMGLRGLTSNPTIFDNAISKSDDYDNAIREIIKKESSVFEIYDNLTIKDIQDAADLFLPVYKNTKGFDGYVSLEINPRLAMNAEETIKEGKRLHKRVARPNLMLKVPATDQGFEPIEEFIASGINVNVTLIFSLSQYEKATYAYIKGLKRLANNGNIKDVHSVASIFVSRIDTAVDEMLDGKIAGSNDENRKSKLDSLKGKAAVANSLLIFEKHKEIFTSQEFIRLKDKGANIQRALWASTSTKNPSYRDIKYVEELMLKNTVNTIPESTLMAFIDHGAVKNALELVKENPSKIISMLKDEGINVFDVCDNLLSQGVKSFEKSFDSLLKSIEKKAEKLFVKG